MVVCIDPLPYIVCVYRKIHALYTVCAKTKQCNSSRVLLVKCDSPCLVIVWWLSNVAGERVVFVPNEFEVDT